MDPRARRFLNLIRAASPGRNEDELVSLRRATDALADFAAPAPAVDRRDLQLDRPARAYAPPGARDTLLPGLVYFHGGGLVSGGLDSHDSICAELAAAGQCRVVAVDYRLGPEHRFPHAHDDARQALRQIAARAEDLAIDPDRLGVGGDSAGGNLAAFAARRAGVKLKLLFLLCPVMDMLAREPSRFALAEGYLIEEATMERYWAHYRVDGLASEDERVAPLRGGGFAAYPPTRIHTAECDPLKDEGAAFANALAAAGVDAALTEHTGQIHHFYGLSAVITSARVALAAVAADLAEGLRTEGGPGGTRRSAVVPDLAGKPEP